jgi:Restriction endonuclease
MDSSGFLAYQIHREEEKIHRAEEREAVECDRVRREAEFAFQNREVLAHLWMDSIDAAFALLSEYQSRLAPEGTNIETAVNAAMIASGIPRNEADFHRDILIKLTRKFMRPAERILGVYIAMELTPRSQVKLAGLVVFLTHGFAVRSGSKQFRAELVGAARHAYIDIENGAVAYTAAALLGDLKLHEKQVENTLVNETGRKYHNTGLPPLYAALLAQEMAFDAAESPAQPSSKRPAKPRPKPILIRTWRDAELVAAEWMKYWGYTNVAATGLGTDGGIDVVSTEAVAQVKAETSATGRPRVQQHHGVAVSEGKIAIFFALGGFTPEARTYAEQNGILLFQFDLQGEPEPVNTLARDLVGS